MPQLFANGAQGTLSVSITNSATSIVLTAGNGLTFPAITGSDYYYCTIENSTRTTREVVKVTARVSDTLTVTRGQDGTTAYAFNSGDFFELRLCRASLQDLNIFNYISSTVPLANGVASAGVGLTFSRTDHVHPADTGKANLSGSLSQFASLGTTSADLRGILSDETGTGVAVFNTSPALVTPILGTPTSGNLVNCTFPTLNQNTTGTAAVALSCSGNSLTSSGMGTPSTPGSISNTSLHGLLMYAKVGSSFDFMLANPTGAGAILYVPTGTSNVVFGGAVSAGNFYGALNGNAASATYATQVGSSPYSQGGLNTNSVQGTVLMGKTGSTYDFSLINPSNTSYIMTVPTGSTSVSFSNIVYAPSFTGTLNGNAATANNASVADQLSGNQTNWSTLRGTSVANMLGWKNYGNGHVIVDASQSTSPVGSLINNTNSQVPWAPSYPTLMGWNGANTYGVRVDSARIADTLAPGAVVVSASNANYAATSNYANSAGYANSVANNTVVVPNLTWGAPWAVKSLAVYPSANWMLWTTQDGRQWGNWGWYSDETLKENIKPSTVNALAALNQIRMVSFNYKPDSQCGGDTNIYTVGVLAQDLNRIDPNMARDVGTDAGHIFPNPNVLISYLIKAVQELSQEIEILKARK